VGWFFSRRTTHSCSSKSSWPCRPWCRR
jgi:hypothetical protein